MYLSPLSRYATSPTLRSGVGLPPAIWLQIDQILSLAPWSRSVMLPVVSRQKTTSTLGRALGFSLTAGAADIAGRTRPARASRAAGSMADRRDMAFSLAGGQDRHQ